MKTTSGFTVPMVEVNAPLSAVTCCIILFDNFLFIFASGWWNSKHLITKLWSPSCFCPQGLNHLLFLKSTWSDLLHYRRGRTIVLGIWKDSRWTDILLIICCCYKSHLYNLSFSSICPVMSVCLWLCSVQSPHKHGMTQFGKFAFPYFESGENSC